MVIYHVISNLASITTRICSFILFFIKSEIILKGKIDTFITGDGFYS